MSRYGMVAQAARLACVRGSLVDYVSYEAYKCPFLSVAQRSDASAFAQLMRHLKEFDEKYCTVIMVQVQNESGLLGDSRDGCVAAEERFSQPVPVELLTFLANDWDNLHSDLRRNIVQFKAQSQARGSWMEVFGNGPQTDEPFMAYHYALYLNHIASAGKTEYPIPLFTNFAPALDFISPDVYLNDYVSICSKYWHRNQPLFIPEQRRDEYGARRIWVAYGSYQAIGVSPFGIDTIEPTTNPFSKDYALIDSLAPIIIEAQQRPGSSSGFFFDELAADGSDPCKAVVHHSGGYELMIERSVVFGKQGPGCGMVIHRGGARFLLIGWGFQVRARSLSLTAAFTGILRFEEKIVINKETGELKTLRVLNGDETGGGAFAVMPNETPGYGGFPIPAVIPARTIIAELEVYSLDESELQLGFVYIP